MQIYWQGLSYPLSFFPEASYNYARSFLKFKDKPKALEAARVSWDGNNYQKIKPEAEDPYLKLCFGQLKDPLDNGFTTISLKIFIPLLNHLKAIRE